MDFFDENGLEIVPHFHGQHCYSESPVNVILFRFKIFFVSQNKFHGYGIENPVFNHSLFFDNVFELD
jgi:hypothetical protein